MPVSFTWGKMVCGFWNRLVAQTSARILRAAFLENLEMSIAGGQGRLWCDEMMKCLSDAVPDYAEQRVRSLVLSNSMSEIVRVDTESVLAILGRKWMECWQDLPEDPRGLSACISRAARGQTTNLACVALLTPMQALRC